MIYKLKLNLFFYMIASEVRPYFTDRNCAQNSNMWNAESWMEEGKMYHLLCVETIIFECYGSKLSTKLLEKNQLWKQNLLNFS